MAPVVVSSIKKIIDHLQILTVSEKEKRNGRTNSRVHEKKKKKKTAFELNGKHPSQIPRVKSSMQKFQKSRPNDVNKNKYLTENNDIFLCHSIEGKEKKEKKRTPKQMDH